MGTATIVDEIGEGLYTVSIDTGSSAIFDRITALETKIAALDLEIVAAQSALNAAKISAAQVYVDLNAAIDVYAAAVRADEPALDELATVNELTKDAYKQRGYVVKAQSKIDSLNAQKKEASLAIDYLSSFDLQSTQDAWCVNYKLDATGAVATIEIPGEPATVVLAPDCAAPVDADDGIVTARPVQNANQLYFNLALLPGWQKYKPTYRIATIIDINRGEDTCSLSLENVQSSAQSLDINQDAYLYDVPIEYMTCNSRAFEIFDSVVVEFVGQDWENPKVIGFETDPKSCGVGIARWSHTVDMYSILSSDDEQGYGDELLEYLRLDAQNGDVQGGYIAAEYRAEGDTEWNHMYVSGYHEPQPFPAGPGGFVFKGENTPTGSRDGEMHIDNMKRLPNEPATQPEYWYSYEYDPRYVASVFCRLFYFPDYQTKTIEFRLSRYDVTKDPPLRIYVHYAYKWTATELQVYNFAEVDYIEDMNLLTGGNFGTTGPITELENYSFPPSDDPDYWGV